MRILIVKLGSIGDIVHTLPSLAAIRRALPSAEVSWVVESRAAEILRSNPVLDRLIVIDTKALRRGLMSGETLRAPRQQLRLLRASAFDLALDFQGLIKSAMIARLSGARRIVGFAREALREPPDCAPCMLRDCPIDHRCMTEISVARVFERAIAMARRPATQTIG